MKTLPFHSSNADALELNGFERVFAYEPLKPFQLKEVIASTLDLFSQEAHLSQIDLSIDLDEATQEYFLGGKTKLRYLLFFLFQYIFQNTHRGFVRFHCRLANTSSVGKVFEFDIYDSGVGLSRQQIHFLLNQSSKNQISNLTELSKSELALILSNELVNLSGGKLALASVPGMGSKYSFRLAFRNQHSEFQPIATKMTLKGTKILLVEDLEINQLIAKGVLENWGASIEIAENGQEAIKKLTANQGTKYHLILMDMQMPVMPGPEATRFIRQKLHLDIPIIALTSNHQRMDREECLNAGMNDFVVKPFDPWELYSKIMQFVKPKVRLKEAAIPQQATENKAKSQKSDLYDLSKLRSMCNDDEQMVSKLQQSFVEKTPALLQQIETYFAETNWEKVAHTAHKLKASIDLLNIQTIRQEIRQIEACSPQTHSEDTVYQWISKVNQVCTLVIAEMLKQA
ncbi:MAG: response regulator [Microscillaceae bacterium]|jgi:CheY-like chemotaxis protein|nr:response regulator [Microscillaceae bacterium]